MKEGIVRTVVRGKQTNTCYYKLLAEGKVLILEDRSQGLEMSLANSIEKVLENLKSQGITAPYIVERGYYEDENGNTQVEYFLITFDGSKPKWNYLNAKTDNEVLEILLG